MTRNDAMNRALDLSEMFILFFDKIYNNTTAEELNHWKSEMQSWLDSVKRIRVKPYNKPLSAQQMMDWFFSCGSDSITLFNNEDEANAYDDFVNDLILGKSVKDVLKG